MIFYSVPSRDHSNGACATASSGAPQIQTCMLTRFAIRACVLLTRRCYVYADGTLHRPYIGQRNFRFRYLLRA